MSCNCNKKMQLIWHVISRHPLNKFRYFYMLCNCDRMCFADWMRFVTLLIVNQEAAHTLQTDSLQAAFFVYPLLSFTFLTSRRPQWFLVGVTTVVGLPCTHSLQAFYTFFSPERMACSLWTTPPPPPKHTLAPDSCTPPVSSLSSSSTTLADLSLTHISVNFMMNMRTVSEM